MRYFMFYAIIFSAAFTACYSKASETNNKRSVITDSVIIGGPCEGCEAIYESPVAFENLQAIDTLPDYFEEGKRLLVKGIVYKADGKTPAPNVVLYVYHTDQNGYYSKKGNETGWGKRHGYIRGWIRTNEKGEYAFYTLKPIAYPNEKIPAHIHATVKEPAYNEYYIDEFLFEDDPLLTTAERNKCENRSGSGIVKTRKENGMLVAERNIYLGLHIPGYADVDATR